MRQFFTVMSVEDKEERIMKLLLKSYPKCLATSQISVTARIPSCALSSYLRTLVSRRAIVLAGKKGRENCYRATEK
jgi:hypothetical protein